MPYPALDPDDGFENSPHYRGMCVLLLIWWLAYLYPLVTINDIVDRLMSASESTQQGSLYNQALIVGFAALGIVHLPRAFRSLRSRQSRVLLGILGTYYLWSLLSIAWSTDRPLSVRRLVSFLLLAVGCFGLGAGFYSRTRNGILTLARHVLAAAIVCVVLLFSLRLAEGDLMDFLNPQWSLKYTTQIESYAFPIGYGMVALVFLFRSQPVRRIAVGATLFVILLLLKGRTLLADVVSAVAISYSRIATTRVVRTATLAIGAALAVVLADLMSGGSYVIEAVLNASDSLAPWLPYLSIGEGLRNITSLSGRLPLWQHLLDRAAEHPYVGYGFGAFWTPDRFAEVFAATKWYAVVAHNGFLDEILATGIVGLILLMAFWIYGLAISYRLGAGGFLVFGWMLLFLFFNTMCSLIQSFFVYPTLVSLIGLSVVLDEYRLYRCEECGEKLLLQSTPQGEVSLCHP